MQLNTNPNSEPQSKYNVLIFASMLYMAIMLCNAIFTNRYIGNDYIFILGGTLTSPFIFIIDDIVAEIYGYKIARNMILGAFITQSLFVMLCQLIINAPHPAFFNDAQTYQSIFGYTLVKINISGFVAYISANILNSYIITKWKVMLNGKKFWLRSLGSSTISEAFYSCFAIALMEVNSIPIEDIIQVIIVSYSIKVLYSLIFSYPLQLLVTKLKTLTGVDVFDLPVRFTPFNELKMQ